MILHDTFPTFFMHGHHIARFPHFGPRTGLKALCEHCSKRTCKLVCTLTQRRGLILSGSMAFFVSTFKRMSLASALLVVIATSFSLQSAWPGGLPYVEHCEPDCYPRTGEKGWCFLSFHPATPLQGSTSPLSPHDRLSAFS